MVAKLRATIEEKGNDLVALEEFHTETDKSLNLLKDEKKIWLKEKKELEMKAEELKKLLEKESGKIEMERKENEAK